MSASGALFKTGLVVLAVGFLVALVVPPLGFLLGRLGMVLIGGALLLPVLSVGLLVVLAVSSSHGGESQPRRRGDRQRDAFPETRRPGTGAAPRGRPVSGTPQPDLDVDSIDDYRR